MVAKNKGNGELVHPMRPGAVIPPQVRLVEPVVLRASQLVLCDGQGFDRVVLEAMPRGLSVCVLDDAGRVRGDVHLLDTGMRASWQSEAGEPLAEVATDPRHGLRVVGADGKRRRNMGVGNQRPSVNKKRGA